MHGRPFRATKDPVQPLAALDSFFTSRQKYLISSWFMKHWSVIQQLSWYVCIGRLEEGGRLVLRALTQHLYHKMFYS